MIKSPLADTRCHGWSRLRASRDRAGGSASADCRDRREIEPGLNLLRSRSIEELLAKALIMTPWGASSGGSNGIGLGSTT